VGLVVPGGKSLLFLGLLPLLGHLANLIFGEAHHLSVSDSLAVSVCAGDLVDEVLW
jgi:hypothetical protein